MSDSVFHSVIQEAVRRIFEASDEELAEGIRRSLNEGGFDARGSDTWLGRYLPMASPGTIQLHWQRLGRLFCETARDLGINRRGEQARLLCEVLVAKTCGHEQFHFLSDVFSRITEVGEKDREMEEALATAWGWFFCQAYARHIGLDPELTTTAVRYWFDGITANGYCRWKEFAHRCFFEDQVATHLQLVTMAASGDGRDIVQGFFMSGTGVAGLCEYKVVEGSGPGVSVFSCAGEASAFPAEVMHQALSLPPGYVPTESSLDLSGGKLSNLGMHFEAGEYEEVLLCGNPIGSLAEEAVIRILDKVSAKRLCLRHCGATKGLVTLAAQKIAEHGKLKSLVLDNHQAQAIFQKYLAGQGDCFDLQCWLLDASLVDFATK